MTEQELAAKKRLVLSAWNSWEANITEIGRSFHVGRPFVRQVIEEALEAKQTERPIIHPKTRESRTGRW